MVMSVEQIILGTFMKENFLIDDASINADHFEKESHKRLFEAMKELRKQRQGIDSVTLMAYYDPREFGGAQKLVEMQEQANPEKVDVYLRALVDAWREREKQNILSKAMLEKWKLDEVMAELDKLQDDSLDDRNSVMDLAVQVTEKPWQEQDEQSGVTTGLRVLNSMTHGLQDAELTIVAARPSMGGLSPLVSAMRQANPVNVIA